LDADPADCTRSRYPGTAILFIVEMDQEEIDPRNEVSRQRKIRYYP
jgi:hypothetical protein